MKENESALYSQYIIDGIRSDMTPADLLDECMEYSDNDMSGNEGSLILLTNPQNLLCRHSHSIFPMTTITFH